MSTQRVSAILVVHDGSTWLPEVVASIASQTRQVDQILAVDTGSADSSAKLLKGARIPVATMDRATGFGAAVAYGVDQLAAPVDGADEWLWILHDDCALTASSLESLLAVLVERPSVVMAGPKLLGWHDRSHLLEVGISLASNGARWTGLEPSEYDQGQRDGIHEVLSVSTAGALIRRDIFEELGGFDQNLELFRDDVDFGWRVRTAGHSVVVVTDAVGYHAQASATERRDVDVKGAFLHRPLLLDRRNAAYVLLANSSFWSLPWLTIQLFAGALFRAIGYLFAKLPGYASDEILAIGSLIIHPNELFEARKARKKSRFVSSRVVKAFIPSRWTQLRSSLSRGFEVIRGRLLPDNSGDTTAALSDLTINEEEDLLVPVAHRPWKLFFTQPIVAVTTLIFVVSLFWARHRIGPISGGALAPSPDGLTDLFKLYLASWHGIGMGSGESTPAWVLLVSTASIFTLGNVPLLITIFFFAAPFLLLLTSYRYLKRFTDNEWLSSGAALLYAFSPVAIASINAGRLGVIIFLALLPIFIGELKNWNDIDQSSWRSVYAYSLFIWLIFAFNPSAILIVLAAVLFRIYRDYVAAEKNYRDSQFIQRVIRRLTLLLIPFLLSAPGSFTYFVHPSRLLGEIGLSVSGGGPNLALLANPGGPGSLPWWAISPIAFVLFVTYFSTTAARKFAALGIVFLLSATLMSALTIHGNGAATSTRVFAGTLLSIATLLSITSAVVMFDKIRTRLQQSHINYRHISVAAVLLLTLFYSTTSIFWLITAGADSPVRTSSKEVLPAFLAIENDAKTVVLRPYRSNGQPTLSYYISRGSSATLGEVDVAPADTDVISGAIEGLVDNTGVTSSKVFADYGIKYVFLKNPVIPEVVQTIDGLGGFNRTSATRDGIVWRVLESTGRIKFVDYSGKEFVLESKGVSANAPTPGTITLTETYSKRWQVFQDGYRLAKIENANGLPTFEVTTGGDISVIHDGTGRRAWISFFLIALVTTVVLALPAGRRRREISESELS
jgi:GT2 family glycosyltransferase